MTDEAREENPDVSSTVSLRQRRRLAAIDRDEALAASRAEVRTVLTFAPDRRWKYQRQSLVSELFVSRVLPSPNIVSEAFSRTGTLVDFANLFGLDRQSAVKALATAGINIHRVIAEEWGRGSTVRELSERHAVTRQTIGAWIKKGGRDVQPRNGNRQHDEDLIVKIYRDTKSANRAAQAAKVHWATARSVLRKHNLWHDK